MAADFKLDLLSLAIPLYARSCMRTAHFVSQFGVACCFFFFLATCVWETGSPGKWGNERGGLREKNVQEASFRRHISMNCLISDTSFGMMGDGEGGILSQIELLVGSRGILDSNLAMCGSG